MKDEPEEITAAEEDAPPPNTPLYDFMMPFAKALEKVKNKDLLFQALHERNTHFLNKENDKNGEIKFFYRIIVECFTNSGENYSAYNNLIKLLEIIIEFQGNREGFDNRVKELEEKRRREEASQPYLTGLEPKEKSNLPIAQNFTRNPYTIIAMAQAAREVDSFNFEITPQGTGAKIPIDKEKKHHVYLLFPNITNPHPITPLDKNILIALSNLYYTRINETADKIGVIITAKDIIRTDRGYDNRDNITQAEIDEVTERMNYLINLSAVMDFTEHYNLYKMNNIKKGDVSGKMVHAVTIKIQDGKGNTATAWKLYAPPELFNYAMQIRQIATVNTDLLDLRIKGKKSVNNTTSANVLRTYLLERILAMIDRRTQTKKRNMSDIITIKDLVDKFNLKFVNNTAKKRKVDTIKNILDKFKITADNKRGTFIKDYKIIIEKRAITGFKIIF